MVALSVAFILISNYIFYRIGKASAINDMLARDHQKLVVSQARKVLEWRASRNTMN